MIKSKKYFGFIAMLGSFMTHGQEAPSAGHYEEEIQPILEKFCIRCHGEKKQKGGFRIDQLANDFSGKKLFSWEKMQHVLTMPLDSDEVMPPEDSKQPSAVERLMLTKWISENLDAGRLRAAEKNGSVRRLTKSQYRNTLRDLLSLDENVGRTLPDDAVSAEGFTNDGKSMQLSPMQMETYFSIAQKALDLAVVNPDEKPQIQNFKVNFGDNINKEPIADKLILGAGSKQLELKNFLVTEPVPQKPFAFEPYKMQRQYRFIEGYKGNSTVREWRDFDSIYHAVFAGTSGPRAPYPKGDPINFSDEGMLMRPSIPAKASWSPTIVWSPRFKISLRELPSTGNFKVKVTAAKFRDSLILKKGSPVVEDNVSTQSIYVDNTAKSELIIPEEGIYQLDIKYLPKAKATNLNLKLGSQTFVLPLQAENGGKNGNKIKVQGSNKKDVSSILIQVPGKDKYINLSEIEVYDRKNKKIKKPLITMSSEYSKVMGPDKFTDGKLNNFGHTQQEDNPWIKIEFNKPTQVSSLIIYNRKGYESRFDGAEFTYFNKEKLIVKRLLNDISEASEIQEGLKVLSLAKGKYPVEIMPNKSLRLDSLRLSPLTKNDDNYHLFTAFEQRHPLVNLQMGFRRDDGSTLNEIGPSQIVDSYEFKSYDFVGSINDFPSPVLNKANANYLAGIREIGLRHDYVTEIDVPRLIIKSVEFEGPYYESWPTKSHQSIFIPSANSENKEKYAKEIIQDFMFRAYRGKVSERDLSVAYKIWQDTYKESNDFRESVKDSLLVILTSPQFLFITEHSNSPEKEKLDDRELASKLSYFLWNSPPDKELMAQAKENKISADLNKQVDAMINDPRFANFAERFTRDWLMLDKFDSIKVDNKLYPKLTTRMKRHLKQEPIEFINYLIQENLELRNIIHSDFTMGNDIVAEYYNIPNENPQGLKFQRLNLTDKNRGGLFTQTSILTGLSDGHESNPVKRGTWMAKKIVAEPPGTPPPNVPNIDEEDKTLTLRQKLEAHRNQKGCKNCHKKIDPWGIPFEMFDAGGYLKAKYEADSELPDGTEVNDLNEMKKYLIEDRMDQVAFSFMKHLAIYATGRSLNFDEVAFLKESSVQLADSGYKTRDLLKFVVNSHIFNTK